jgi:glycosyltransferase involved in cell wall biosynthesis
MKLASVIIPVYRAEKYIAATVQSILEQTYKNLELLLIDDGSPDKSIEICQQFADPRIRIIRQENRGVSAARNLGIREAKGEYIGFLDADDIWLPTKLEKHIQHLENSPHVGVSYSYTAFIDAAGNSLGIFQLPKTQNITPLNFLLRDPIGSGSNLVARREVFQAIEFPDNHHGVVENCYFDEDPDFVIEDTECWLRIAVKSHLKFEGIPEVLTQYRMHPEGRSYHFIEKTASWDKLLEKARTYAPELIAKYANAARAYQFTALARRAIYQGAGAMAVQLNHRALAAYWRILLEEPRRTLVTIAAAYLLFLLPKPIYKQMQSLAFGATSVSHKRRLVANSTVSV